MKVADQVRRVAEQPLMGVRSRSVGIPLFSTATHNSFKQGLEHFTPLKAHSSW